MNRGLLAGVKNGLFVPEQYGGGDPAQDGTMLAADSTQPGGVKLDPRIGSGAVLPTYLPLSGTSKRLVLPVNSNLGVSNINAVEALMVIYGLPVMQPCTLNEIFIAVNSLGSAGAVIRFGVWTPVGLLALDAGTINSGPGGATQAVSLTIRQPVTPGLWWVSYAAQGAAVTPAVMRMASCSTATIGSLLPDPNMNGVYQSGSRSAGWSMSGITGALPASLSSLTALSAASGVNIAPMGVGWQ